jgi:hypothetical protein
VPGPWSNIFTPGDSCALPNHHQSSSSTATLAMLKDKANCNRTHIWEWQSVGWWNPCCVLLGFVCDLQWEGSHFGCLWSSVSGDALAFDPVLTKQLGAVSLVADSSDGLEGSGCFYFYILVCHCLYGLSSGPSYSSWCWKIIFLAGLIFLFGL